MRWILIYLLATILCAYSDGKESFYDILGVPNDADTRAIRKAFKKIAIVKHPDKNKDNPDAHAEFVRINRAYEVLKDDELRKKYDQYGEEGLDGNANQNNQKYQSWQFYKDNFGIYDEDVEIVTLSRTDFQDEVFESNDFWFINFYSTFCSHCHALAPAWREFAKAMDGIVKVGAVNCAEDPVLCQSQHVMGYPSLVVYPERVFYQGPRDVQSLINFIISRMTAPIYELWSTDEAAAVGRANGLPLVVEYCDEQETCLTFSERKKIAAMLSGLANFGIVDRSTTKEMGASLLNHGVAFYPSSVLSKENQHELDFMEPKDLYLSILRKIEAINQISADDLKGLLRRNDDKDAHERLVLFFKDLERAEERELLEYKKLRSFSSKLRVHFADCSKLSSECYQRLHLKNLPKALLFRSHGGFDINYESKMSVREVTKFLRKSISSTLIAITDEQYDEIFEASRDDLLIVDYFAPWCPPCLRLIRELRNLPATIGGRRLRVATVDCDAYQSICTHLNIKSYPTSVLYGNGESYTSVGFHGVEEIVEFVEESLNPSVAHLTYDVFQKMVANRPRGRVAIIDFYVTWCSPCQQLAPEFRKLARSFRNNTDLAFFGMVDCEAQRRLCADVGIHSYPALRLFDGLQNAEPKHYPPNWWRDFKFMQHWVNEQLPSLVERLSGNFHTDILGSAIPILVDYYAPWCGHCIQFTPILESVAKFLEGDVRVGKVNCDMTPYLCQMASVQAYPSLRLYLGASYNPQPYGIAIQPIPKADYVVQIVDSILARNGLRRRGGYKDEL